MPDSDTNSEGLPPAKLVYDADDVDHVIDVLKAELRAVTERAERAEQALVGQQADAALVGRALRLVQQAALESTGQAIELPVEVEPPQPHYPERPMPARARPDEGDTFFAELQRALDDGEPLGPRDDTLEGATGEAELVLWPEIERWPRPRIRAQSAAAWVVMAVGVLLPRRT